MMQTAMEKKVWGRPSKYDPKYCDMIVDFMRKGKSLVGFAGTIGVHVDTLYEWEKVHADFSEAIKQARALCQLWWEDQGQVGLFMGKEDGSFSQSAWIFNMKARFGYRDKQEVDLNVSEIKITKEDEDL